MLDIRDMPSIVPGGAPAGPFDASVSGLVPDRLDLGDEGPSEADDSTTGDLVNLGPPDGLAVGQPSSPSTAAAQARRWGVQTILGLSGDETLILQPGGAEGTNRTVLPADRAGAPTDDGRLPTMIARSLTAPSVWTDNPGAGVKINTPSPLAAPPFFAGASVPDALPSAGGSGPALMAVDPVPYNTWRVPPTPWDEARYIGGPNDG